MESLLAVKSASCFSLVGRQKMAASGGVKKDDMISQVAE